MNVLYGGLPATRVRRSANKIIVVEEERAIGVEAGISTVGLDPVTGQTTVIVFFTRRHTGMCNVGFFDGHAERFDPKELENPQATMGNAWVYTDAYAHFVDVFADR